MRALLAAMVLLFGLGSAPPEPDLNALIGDNTKAGAGGGLLPRIEIESASRPSGQRAATAVPANLTPEEMPHLDTVELPLEPINPDTTPKQGTLNELCDALLTAAQNNGLPVQFFANLIWQESGLRNDTVSRVGALGIAQFMPETAKENGLNDPFDPHQAIPASAKLLQQLRDQFGNLGLAAAAYNAGPHRVSDWLASGQALPHETLDYVLRVTGRSADQWRTAPPPESAVTFTQELPCRAMPAFASLEQSQAQQAPTEAAQQAPAASDDQKTKAAPQPKNEPAHERLATSNLGTNNKALLARARVKTLKIASRDEKPFKRASRHVHQAAHERPRDERGRTRADTREG
jgi:hypothetical protein